MTECRGRQPWRAGVTRALAAAAAAVLLAMPPAALEGAEKKKKKGAEEATGPELELKKAVAGGEIERALELVEQLGGTGELAAYKAIIRHALSGADYDLEKQAGAVLAKSKDPAVRALILEELGHHNNYKTRIVLLALAARMADDPAALEAIHAALKDPRAASHASRPSAGFASSSARNPWPSWSPSSRSARRSRESGSTMTS